MPSPDTASEPDTSALAAVALPAPLPPLAARAPSLSRYALVSRLMLDSDTLLHSPEELQSVISAAQRGVYALKFGRSGKPQKRFLAVTRDGSGLMWLSHRKKLADSTIAFGDVERVQKGMHTSTFARHAKEFKSVSHCALSVIVYDARSLDVIFDSPSVRDDWYTCLTACVCRAHVGSDDSDLKHLRRAWLDAGGDASPTLDFNAVRAILKRLNIYKSKRELKSLVESVCAAAGSITWDDFTTLIDRMRDRPDISRVFSSLTPAGAALMDVHTFHRFLLERQHEAGVTLEAAARIMAYYGTTEGARMDLTAFTSFLTSSHNRAFAPESGAVHMDMTAPLSHYYIRSSHNTYLEGDQLTSAASVSAYISALQKGCRCVEIDVWDGPTGAPIVTHGHTFTSTLTFDHVCEAIAQYAWRTSMYPVILSLEIHASKPAQDAMADTLQRVFGDALALLPASDGDAAAWSALPSPTALMRKVIVKAKWKTGAASAVTGAASGASAAAAAAGGVSPALAHVCVQEENVQEAAPADVGSRSRGRTMSGATGPPTTTSSPGSAAAAAAAVGGSEEVAVEPGVYLASARLRAAVYLQSVKFVSYAHSATHERVTHISSIKEARAAAVLAKDPGCAGMISHTMRQLLRVYPSPFRVDSSNYSPSPYWAAGVQMVALNYQTPDVPLRLEQALFKLNGRTGYVLKPAYMRGGAHSPTPVYPSAATGSVTVHTVGAASTRSAARGRAPSLSATTVADMDAATGVTAPDVGVIRTAAVSAAGDTARPLSRTMNWLMRSGGASPGSRASSHSGARVPTPSPLIVPSHMPVAEPFTLRVTVMSAQYLPKRADAASNVPSPYVTVLVYGDPLDCVKHKTRVIADNGFNPVWSETFEFMLWRPEVAILYMGVHDAISEVGGMRNSFIAYFACPMIALRKGMRSCQLRNMYGKKIPFCSLLCEFERR